MKKTGRNKILLGFSIGFAVVSLSTVGLATWLIGLQNNKVVLDNINVVVDGISDETSYLNIKVADDDHGINISDTINAEVAPETGGVSLDGEPNNDFEVKLSSFDIVYSEDAKFKSLNIDVKLDNEEFPVATLSESTLSESTITFPDKSTTTDYFGRSGESLTFIDFVDKTSFTKEADLTSNGYTSVSDYEGYKFFKKSNTSEKDYQSFEFTWGSIFGNKSPIEYYNEKIKSAETTDAKLNMLNQVKVELSQLNKLFTGKTIKITVTLDVGSNSN